MAACAGHVATTAVATRGSEVDGGTRGGVADAGTDGDEADRPTSGDESPSNIVPTLTTVNCATGGTRTSYSTSQEAR